MAEKKGYDVTTIKVLSGLEGVRRRPAMYIGSTGKEGLHHLVYEVVDNSVDEALAGFCKKILVKICKDNSVIVRDDGRGIPTEIHPIHKKSGLEIVMTTLHAGGKFDHKAYLISGGLHGVGVSVVNALSEWLIARVKRNGKIYQQKYKRGKPVTEVKVIGSCKPNDTGTEIHFKPDKEIFSTTKFDFSAICNRMREIAFLIPDLTIIVESEEAKKKEVFHAAGGLKEFIRFVNRTKKPLHKVIYFKGKANDVSVEVAIQYTDTYYEDIFGFVNTINTVEGGTHITGFKTALTKVINDYAIKTGMLKNSKVRIEGNDVREGLTAIVSIYLKEPQFEGQTKTKLGNSEVKGITESIVTQNLSQFFEENPSVGKVIVAKALEERKGICKKKKRFEFN